MKVFFIRQANLRQCIQVVFCEDCITTACECITTACEFHSLSPQEKEGGSQVTGSAVDPSTIFTGGTEVDSKLFSSRTSGYLEAAAARLSQNSDGPCDLKEIAIRR